MASRGDTTPTVSGPRPTSPRGVRGRVLILGGTAEGRKLANLLAEAGYSTVTSLAGVTRMPSEISGAIRIGAFASAEELAHYLATERFSCIVDATHPFATTI